MAQMKESKKNISPEEWAFIVKDEQELPTSFRHFWVSEPFLKAAYHYERSREVLFECYSPEVPEISTDFLKFHYYHYEWAEVQRKLAEAEGFYGEKESEGLSEEEKTILKQKCTKRLRYLEEQYLPKRKKRRQTPLSLKEKRENREIDAESKDRAVIKKKEIYNQLCKADQIKIETPFLCLPLEEQESLRKSSEGIYGNHALVNVDLHQEYKNCDSVHTIYLDWNFENSALENAFTKFLKDNRGNRKPRFPKNKAGRDPEVRTALRDLAAYRLHKHIGSPTKVLEFLGARLPSTSDDGLYSSDSNLLKAVNRAKIAIKEESMWLLAFSELWEEE